MSYVRMSQNMIALKWQLTQSKISENFGKWRPYLELFWGHRGRGQKFHWGAAPCFFPLNDRHLYQKIQNIADYHIYMTCVPKTFFSFPHVCHRLMSNTCIPQVHCLHTWNVDPCTPSSRHRLSSTASISAVSSVTFDLWSTNDPGQQTWCLCALISVSSD